MDIRTAKKQPGTRQKRATTPETVYQQETTNEAVEAIKPDTLEDYGGDVVVSQYMGVLKENGITREDIFTVLDNIITSGSTEWSFDLFGRIPCTLRMRETWQSDLVMQKADEVVHNRPSITVAAYNNVTAELNLAASLIKFRDAAYTIETEEDFAEAEARIRKLPYAVLSALVAKLCVFDRLVHVATSDWAVKNFTKPRSEN